VTIAALEKALAHLHRPGARPPQANDGK